MTVGYKQRSLNGTTTASPLRNVGYNVYTLLEICYLLQQKMFCIRLCILWLKIRLCGIMWRTVKWVWLVFCVIHTVNKKQACLLIGISKFAIMEMITSFYVQLIKHRYTICHFIWVTIIHDFCPLWRVGNSLLVQINIWKRGTRVSYGQHAFVRQEQIGNHFTAKLNHYK